MKRAALTMFGFWLLVGAAGCALVPQRYQLAAAPLIEVPPAVAVQPVPPVPPGAVVVPPGAAPPTTYVVLSPLERVNLIVQDSQKKCAEFVDSMFAETAGSGLVLDVLGTGASVVSSIVTPLSSAHALGAAASILGAAKTGISANYLNTLSISHITQAIQSTYTSDMKNYVNSLAALVPEQQRLLDPYMERSKIQSYHAECSLAAAEGSISTTLQSSGPTGQPTPSLTYTVVGAGDTSAAGLATALAVAINNYPAFQRAGITALVSGSAVISIGMKNALNFSVTGSSANFKVAVVQGTPTKPAQVPISITGALKRGDTVTVAATPAAATQQPSVSGDTAPAAAAAQPTTSH